MRDVSVVREGQSIHDPLRAFYPTLVDVPLPVFLLHEDSKLHTSLEFDRQTAALVGSNHDLQQALAYGLQEQSAQLDRLGQLASETNAELRSISGALEKVCEHLTLVERAVNRVELTLEVVGAGIIKSIQQVELAIHQLSATASSIQKMVQSSELTRAREQASVASRALQVGDVDLAREAVSKALTMAPTHVEIMLLASEINLRRGREGFSDSADMLTRAHRYLALEPSEAMQGRYQFCKGTLYLKQGEDLGNRQLLIEAVKAFDASGKTKTYNVAGLIYSGVARTSLGLSPDDISPILVKALLASPRCGVEVWRLRSRGLRRETVEAAFREATRALYIRNSHSLELKKMLSKTEGALKLAENVSSFSSSHELKRQNLARLEHLLNRSLSIHDRRVKANSFLSAFLLGRDKSVFERELASSRQRMGV